MAEKITWQAEIKGLMFAHSIKSKDVAKQLDCSEEWISKLFNGKATSRDAEERIRAAVDDIIRERSIANAEG